MGQNLNFLFEESTTSSILSAVPSILCDSYENVNFKLSNSETVFKTQKLISNGQHFYNACWMQPFTTLPPPPPPPPGFQFLL